MISIAPAPQTNWDWRAAGNFLCGGSGTGLLAVAAVAAFETPGIVRPAAVVSLGLVGLGLFLVWLEIGRPWRFANVFRNPATSWMSREAWAALFLFAAGGFAFLGGSPGWMAAAALFGFVFLICQGQMLRASCGIPAWRDAVTLPLIVTTGFAEGAGIFLAGAALAGKAPVWLPSAFLLLVGLRVALMAVYAARLLGGRAPVAVRKRLIEALAIVVGLGGLVPGLILLLAPGSTASAIAAGSLAAAAGWVLKFIIIRKLAFNQGFAIEHIPARGAPSAGTASHPGW